MRDEDPKTAHSVELKDLSPPSGPSSISEDALAVRKLGLTPTVPRTLEKIIGLIGLCSSVVCPWPTFYAASVLNLANGGTGGLLAATIVACVFMSFVYISLAEKIRKYPTAGGQYHWVSALAPRRYRKFLGFSCGFLLAFTWLAFLSAAAYLFGLIIAAVVLIHTGEYHYWYVFVSAMGMQVLSCAVNITWGKHMNVPETLVVIIHLVAFFLLVGVLGFASGSGTLTANLSFTSAGTGWGPGMGFALGLVYVVGVLSGFDCASHIAEDTVDAAKRVPRSLLWSTFVNKLSCLICVGLIIATAGDVDSLFTGPLGASGHPLGAIVQLTFNATRGNKSLSSAVFGLIAPIFMMCCINTTAAASRMVFSFIRDDRNPFVQKLMATDLERHQVPRKTIAICAACPALLLWINFLTNVGFSAIVSQNTMALASTYIMAIGCSLYSRIYQPDILGREWNGIFQLGQFWGIINDAIAVLFLAVIWVFCWFPYVTPIPNAAYINYAPIVVCGVVALGVGYYFLYARKHCQNPAPDEIGDVDV